MRATCHDYILSRSVGSRRIIGDLSVALSESGVECEDQEIVSTRERERRPKHANEEQSNTANESPRITGGEANGTDARSDHPRKTRTTSRTQLYRCRCKGIRNGREASSQLLHLELVQQENAEEEDGEATNQQTEDIEAGEERQQTDDLQNEAGQRNEEVHPTDLRKGSVNIHILHGTQGIRSTLSMRE